MIDLCLLDHWLAYNSEWYPEAIDSKYELDDPTTLYVDLQRKDKREMPVWKSATDPNWLPDTFIGPGSLTQKSEKARSAREAAHERTKQIGHYTELQKTKNVELAERTGRFSVTFTTGPFTEGTSSILVFESPGINAGRKYLQDMGDIFGRAVYPAARDMNRRIREAEQPGSTEGMLSPWQEDAPTDSDEDEDTPADVEEKNVGGLKRGGSGKGEKVSGKTNGKAKRGGNARGK